MQPIVKVHKMARLHGDAYDLLRWTADQLGQPLSTALDRAIVAYYRSYRAGAVGIAPGCPVEGVHVGIPNDVLDRMAERRAQESNQESN